MSTFKELTSSGQWDTVRNEIKYAFQATNTRGWIVVFNKDSSVKKNIFVGLPGQYFQPVKGRDKVRNPEGKLVPFADDDQLHPVYNQAWYEKKSGVQVVASTETLAAYPLDHHKQNSIILPESFDLPTQIFGAGPLGLQIAMLVSKLGTKDLKIFDPDPLDKQDVALGLHRIFDPERPKAITVEEIVMNHTMKKIAVQTTPEVTSPVVIQTSENMATRKEIWEKIKTNPEVRLLIDVQMNGEKGSVYTVIPDDEESIRIYECALNVEESQKAGVIYMTSILGGLAVGALKRYLRGETVDRFYSIDANIFFSEHASLSKTTK